MKDIQDNFISANRHTAQQAKGAGENILSDASMHLLTHHLKSFQNNDLEAVMSDYTDESVLITQDAIYTGLQDIRAFFAGLITHFPKQDASLEVDKTVVKDSLVYIVWHAKTPSLKVPLASDTFVIKENKIYQQTFVAQLEFIM